MGNFDWKSYIPSVFLSIASGFAGGFLSIQHNIAELDKRVAIIETREIAFEQGADRRELAIKEINSAIREHELESERRFLDQRKRKGVSNYDP